MKTMVFDVPAEHGGALTILKQYYEEAVFDIEKEWIFVISTPDLKETKNVKILKYPWVKKSWFHRLYFDKFIAKKIVDKYKVDEVLSLQNVIVKKLSVPQTLYLHQSLPFVEKRYKIAENFKFWVYQNIIGRMILKSIKEADKVIVQTEWLREECLKKVKTAPSKFELIHPDVNIKVKKYYKQENENLKLFFYPASGAEYKNHKIIVEVTKELIASGITNFKVIFTLNGNESNHIKNLYKSVKEENLPINFIGQISIEEVYDYYSKSILIFPSYIETFGLPMLEAKMHNSPVFASDCLFSHEILDGYVNAYFFDSFNSEKLVELMISIIENKLNIQQ
ncbi:glycosyltransferase [Clostridia bacterium]|nr:glycosyltransferase [Clostridia bacterium]